MNYRTVKFPIVKNGNMFVYPDDKKLFRHTVEDGLGSWIAGYKGVLPLPTYSGEWPVRFYRKEVTSRELIHLFTFDEWEEVESLTQAAALRFLSLLSRREESFSIENIKVVQFLDAIAANTPITIARIDEIKKGIKI